MRVMHTIHTYIVKARAAESGSGREWVKFQRGNGKETVITFLLHKFLRIIILIKIIVSLALDLEKVPLIRCVLLVFVLGLN